MIYDDILDAPSVTRKQLTQVVSGIQKVLDDNLIGIYLHGSLAMGCFNPERSDIDLLVVTERDLAIEEKRPLIELLLQFSGAPHPIEISFLHREDLDPWEYPTLFDLHFSEEWRDRYTRELASGTWQQWNEPPRPRDPDLAAHVTIVRHRGICLVGLPINEVFPTVPREHYLDSILADLKWGLQRLADNPMYGILNACRVYWYVRDSQICSKAEAGQWALGLPSELLPDEHKASVAQALALYRGERHEASFDQASLARFADRVRRLIKG